MHICTHTATPASFGALGRKTPSRAPQKAMGGTLLQQLAAWWPPRRFQASVMAAGPVLETAASASISPARTHLIVMVHGLFGTRNNWRAISELLAQQLDPTSTLLFVSHCNERQRTFEGVDACGERLAAEVRQVAAQHPSLTRISLLGHSMGGLISRYAAGRLYDPAAGTIAGLAPCHFIAMATPHLGCDAQSNPAQVPLISWLAAVPAVGGAVHSVVSELAAPVSELAMGRAGRQFFLLDDDEGSSPGAPPSQEQPEQPAAVVEAGPNANGGGSRSSDITKSSSSGSQRRAPLLYRLTQDHPDEGLLFVSALAAFETRTLYANSLGDHLVGWANSSLRRLGELPTKTGRGAGVVREDPLEAAWAPHQRPAALHSGQGHQLSESDILDAETAGQLADSAGANQLAGTTATATAANNSSLASDTSSSSLAGGTNSLSPEEQRVEEMLCRLQALSWRRVDVCFGATLLPLLSHQHIQMQRWWVNWPGRAVVKHLALQIQAMEQLRSQREEQQQDQLPIPGPHEEQQQPERQEQRQQETSRVAAS